MEARNQTNGAFIKLSHPINCIPAGVYEVVDREIGCITLTVGQTIFIGILGDISPFVEPVSRKEGKRSRITTERFIPQYQALMEATKGKKFESGQPVTFCIMDPLTGGAMH